MRGSPVSGHPGVTAPERGFCRGDGSPRAIKIPDSMPGHRGGAHDEVEHISEPMRGVAAPPPAGLGAHPRQAVVASRCRSPPRWTHAAGRASQTSAHTASACGPGCGSAPARAASEDRLPSPDDHILGLPRQVRAVEAGQVIAEDAGLGRLASDHVPHRLMQAAGDQVPVRQGHRRARASTPTSVWLRRNAALTWVTCSSTGSRPARMLNVYRPGPAPGDQACPPHGPGCRAREDGAMCLPAPIGRRRLTAPRPARAVSRSQPGPIRRAADQPPAPPSLRNAPTVIDNHVDNYIGEAVAEAVPARRAGPSAQLV